ncbi:MAG: IS481 family transposase [Acidobacteria bacterium]|nr:MAG: IS481 family transposase [Acidobacteriota bacterium]
MKNQVNEQIQERKVKARLRMLQHAQRVSGNVSLTCRFFGVSRTHFYIWKKRYEKNGLAGLRDQSRRPHHIRYRIPPEIVSLILRIREERRYGAIRTSLYLQRHYHAYVSPTTIFKIFRRHRVGHVSLKKYRPGPRPTDAPLQVPGRSVQLDVKFVPRIGRARQRFYQFTAIDEATRFRVLRIYDHNNTKTAIDFLREVREHFPFAIQKIQTDNDSSFGPQFTWHLSDLSISHRHIPPGRPEANGKVERSHKTDSEEFYRGKYFRHKKDLTRKLKKWEAEYNEDRPHLALKGKTPAERVRELVQPSKPVRDLS